MLLALAAIWGASFLLTEIALRDLEPATLILFRLGTGALALALYIPFSAGRFAQLRPYVWALALMGVLNSAFPFFLIAWGQQYIDSGVAAIFNASAPLFTALLALGLDSTQRVSGLRLVGLILGFGATSVAYLRYLGLIAGAGASRAILVTYLVPSIALVYGAVLLDETISALALIGLALVLSGVALGTRRAQVAS